MRVSIDVSMDDLITLFDAVTMATEHLCDKDIDPHNLIEKFDNMENKIRGWMRTVAIAEGIN